ncbi:MAG: hypothetical protein HDS21_01725 [Bacteroides sp.]|nr:hypothetical protein [Bacteroides sp.]
MKISWKIVLAILLVIAFITGFYFGGSSLSESRDIAHPEMTSDTADSLPDFRPVTVEDIGVDSIRLAYWQPDGLDEVGCITPTKSEMTVEINLFRDTTVSISDYDRSVILRSIDSLFISRTSRPIEKVITIGVDHSSISPSLDLTIYKNGKSYYYNIYPAELIGLEKAYLFSAPCYELIKTMVFIGSETKNPLDGKCRRIYGDPRQELRNELVNYFYPDSVPQNVMRQI